MPILNVEPTDEYDVPYSEHDESADSFIDQVGVLANTAELQVELGAPLEVTEEDAEREKQLLEAALRSKRIEGFQTPTTAFAAAGFLRTYGSQLALDVAEARSAITHKLFTSRSEITVNYKDPEALEEAIKERVKRLLNADILDVTPLNADLDEELGIAGQEYEEEWEEESEEEEPTENQEDQNE